MYIPIKSTSWQHYIRLGGYPALAEEDMTEGWLAFEVKTEHVSPIDAHHLLNVEPILDKPLLHSFVLSNDNETHHFSDKVTDVHAAMFLG